MYALTDMDSMWRKCDLMQNLVRLFPSAKYERRAILAFAENCGKIGRHEYEVKSFFESKF
jgi:outer membrane protein assembly factor BamD (BamD/ComL family)